jgi:hypothetical protein
MTISRHIYKNYEKFPSPYQLGVGENLYDFNSSPAVGREETAKRWLPGSSYQRNAKPNIKNNLNPFALDHAKRPQRKYLIKDSENVNARRQTRGTERIEQNRISYTLFQATTFVTLCTVKHEDFMSQLPGYYMSRFRISTLVQ